MSKKKHYFLNEDAEYCYPLKYWHEYIKENNLKELEIFEAERETSSNFFFCVEVGEAGEKGQGSCGKNCNTYEPRNKKNGICVNNRPCYFAGKSKILKLKEDEK